MISPRHPPYISRACCHAAAFGLAILILLAVVTVPALAGDLLRGGFTAAHTGSTVPGSFTPPSVAQARKNANDVLARTTSAIQSVTAMQSAARALALTGANNLGINPNNPTQSLPAVPNGLVAGGLLPTGGVSQLPSGWTGIKSLTQSQSSGATTVTVTQSSPDAVLTWTSFNIGKQTTLDFNQSAGAADESKWIAFNIVQDPSGVPSQILGSINAGGQVYVIDQNGIIFGGSSQVNLHTLVASSLPIDSYLLGRGLLNNPDQQFLFSALAQPAGPKGSPAFTPPASFTPSGADGDVTVQPGARIVAPASASGVGGRVALIGPAVTNDGSISTPDGQTILAAGLQVGIAAHSSSDPTLRGLDVYVGAISSPAYPSSATAGIVTNSGDISVPSGDAMIVGAVVDQLGVIASTTSVTLNGRIDLLADFNALSSGGISGVAPYFDTSAGQVVMGPGSVTQVLPEWSSADRVVGTSLALASQVNVQGLAIHMASGAQLFAPSADVTFDAGIWNFETQTSTPVDTFVHSTGQIYLDSGATIDVQGSWDVSAPVSENIISAQLLGPELADSPLQRDGVFRGQTINIDIRDAGIYNGQAWVGTPLADVSGYVGLIQRTVAELTTAGGSVNLDAGGSVVMQPGSQVNVSGGWIDYQGGIVTTSEVISGGHVYPISQATPDLVYAGFNLGTFTINHPTYGLSQTFTDPLLNVSHYEDAYVQGFAGGALSVTAPATALDGQFLGNTVAGPRQLQVLPAPSQFNLAFLTQRNVSGGGQSYSPTPPDVTFAFVDDLPAAAPFSLDSSGNPLPLSADREKTVILSPDLVTTDGFGKIDINNGDGNITVPSGVTLRPGAEGSVTFAGANITIDGSIIVPDGTLSFTAYDFTPYNILAAPTVTPPDDPTRGHFILGSSATLSTAGLEVDNRSGVSTANSLPVALAGGVVSLDALDVNLESGSLIDVSGGVELVSNGKPDYGTAGSISILAGRDPGFAAIPGGKLLLDSVLLGYSGATGGSLTLQAPLIQVGGASANPDVTLISPAFFSQGGFSSFSLKGVGAMVGNGVYTPGIDIAPGTQIDPVITSLVVEPAGSNLSLTQTILPVGTRSPVDLSFTALGLTDSVTGVLDVRGDLLMGAGSLIHTDPLGTVSFSGQTVAILGGVFAPGGTITVSGASSSLGIFAGNNATTLPTVDLGPQSVLSTAGVTLLTPNTKDYRTGSVLNGGTITVAGNIVAEAGSLLDVSGATDSLDVSPLSVNIGLNGYSTQDSPLAFAQNGSLAGYVLVLARVDSSGGTITLSGGEDLFSDATLRADAGGPSAVGGKLVVSSGLSDPNIPPSTPTLTVTQGAHSIPFAPFYPSGGDAIGHAVVDSHGNPVAPTGYFTADDFLSGGFASLTLKGSVGFNGPVDINATGTLDIATGGVIAANSRVTLQAPCVELGTPFLPPLAPSQVAAPFVFQGGSYYFAPTYGSGALTVIASLIDIGNLSLQGIGNASFIANNGDIRGDGTLDLAGNITMRAGQVYPPTAVTFTIAAFDYTVGAVTHPGTVTFQSAGDRETPLSAGGVLDVYASEINQGGVLRAPFGTINLGWDGSGTAPVDPITNSAVDASKTITLSAGGITSVSGIDSLTGLPMEIPYGINPDGTNWIDPVGNDITAGGLPQKSIHIAGANIVEQHGATIDIRGGGDLIAYQFQQGVGGSTDILGSPGSFAIIPGYQAAYAPYAPFNPNPLTNDLNGDPGYVNAKLAIGQQVYLSAQGTLPAGVYTLLPARYALLPGAFLVTPNAAAAAGNQTLPDGSYIVSGYQTTAFQTGRTAPSLATSFEVDTASVVASRAQYLTYSANTFLANGALSNGAPVPRLPRDSGQLVFNATQGLTVAGALQAQSVSGGLGGLVDISSPANIVISGPAGSGVNPPGALVLNAAELSSFGAASLLIGGTRDIAADGASITVSTDSITVDNAGAPLTGADIILVSNGSITVDPNSEIESSGVSSGAEPLTLTGNGALLRVSSDPTATVTRTGVTPSSTALLTIGAGATISGASVTLDSSGATNLDPTATLKGASIALDSGRISIELTPPAAAPADPGLILTGPALNTLFAGAQSLSLLSYNSIDIYGPGQLGALNSAGQPMLRDLTLSAGEIRGFGTGTVTIAAQNVLLENRAAAPSPGPTDSGGTLTINADTIAFGANALAIDQFTTVNLNAPSGIIARAPSGSLAVSGALNLATPLITGAAGAKQTISSAASLTIQAPSAAATPAVTPGLAASLTFIAASITDDFTAIKLPSGSLTLHATTGNLTVGDLTAPGLPPASIDVAGQARTIFDLTKYTSAGQVTLIADQGAVSLDANSSLTLSAQPGGGNAGSLTITAPAGTLTLAGLLSAQPGLGGQSGSFSLDIGSLPTLSSLDTTLNSAGFDLSRSIQVRSGDVLVDGLATTANFSLSADSGSITVSGQLNASGQTGGAISLQASGSVILLPTADLTVAAQAFNSAGKGGSVSLEAGSDINGVASPTALVDIQTGSAIDLSVAGPAPTLGDLAGTLHIRAPQNAAATDLQVNPIDGAILGASTITVEGYAIYNTSSDAGSIDDQEAAVSTNGGTFVGNTSAISSRLLANNPALSLLIVPGAEIINSTGDLVLANTWDLSSFRFGPDNVPGDLTLRASGNVVLDFGASLNDGFSGALLWQDKLMPVGSLSWSYRITAGADFSSADYAAVQSLSLLAPGEGSLLLGSGAPALPSGIQTGRGSVVPDYFQTIRTGAGDIAIAAGRDVQLLDTLATIYTAGTQAPPIANFSTPNTKYGPSADGATQNPFYPAQYSYQGGDLSISAQDNIEHLLMSPSGQLLPDSSLELPTSWLYRRGYIDPTTGQFGILQASTGVASTTWWIDFSNFYEGVGALGGGNVTLSAGNDIVNVDAVIPTNARMPQGTPSASSLVQLGGGDLTVRAGADINGGVYYVQRGSGLLSAGGSILTNSTRAALTTLQIASGDNSNPATWLPTTLFLGSGSFAVTAGASLLLGPVANPFLLPSGINNSYLNKSYFSTYASTDSVDVSSLSGNVTLKGETSSVGQDGSLLSWYQNIFLGFSNPSSQASTSQPWLLIDETNVAPFAAVAALMPSTLRVTAFSGNIDIDGQLTLAPAPDGTLDLAASGSINGFQPDAADLSNGLQSWTSSVINISDANPASIPGITSPIGTNDPATGLQLTAVTALFAASGSIQGSHAVIQTRQALHSSGPLHAADATPVHLYAQSGDVSGLTLYSPKFTDVLAGRDITDASFYIQNDNPSNITVISAGRDIIPYDPQSLLRQQAQTPGNEIPGIVLGEDNPGSGDPNAGDIQIAGPGTLELLAGRNLTLGVGQNNSDGTAVGVTSIGNAANPYLPFQGSQILAAAGLGGLAIGLDAGTLDFQSFATTILAGPAAARYFSDLATAEPALNVPTYAAYQKLPGQQQAIVALDLFYLVLRDAGRDHNLPASPAFGTYTAGLAAIQALLPSHSYNGSIDLTSKEIKTESGGDIAILAPGGQLTVGIQLAGAQPVDQGILTQDGGNISIYTQDSVIVGTSRIFTLRGGDEVIWSNAGNIAAGESAKTVQSAPPTRVLVDPQSADVDTDLAGLATGGGIGVLASVVGVAPGSVDLIAPTGVIDAGDAGIRATGNLNLAAVQVLNASNIASGGASSGVPVVAVAAPNLAGLSAASSAAGAGSAAANEQAGNQAQQQSQQDTSASIITVSVIGYGGGDATDSGG